MTVTRLPMGGYAANCYLLEENGEGIIIDPAVPVEGLRRVHPAPVHIKALVLTHGHFDHMLTLNEWRAETGAQLYIHAGDAAALQDNDINCFNLFLRQGPTFAPAEVLLQAGDTLSVGDTVLTVVHTPGHTPGSICLSAGDVLITGDTLFAGSYGRYDLPGGNGEVLLSTLCRLTGLEGDPLLYPGHGEATRLSRERRWICNLVL